MTPAELFPKPITAEGATATPEQLREAWTLFWLCECQTAGDLTAILEDQDVPDRGPKGYHWPSYRIADRMLQRARKAGVIRYERGRWVLVEGGQ